MPREMILKLKFPHISYRDYHLYLQLEDKLKEYGLNYELTNRNNGYGYDVGNNYRILPYHGTRSEYFVTCERQKVLDGCTLEIYKGED